VRKNKSKQSDEKTNKNKVTKTKRNKVRKSKQNKTTKCTTLKKSSQAGKTICRCIMPSGSSDRLSFNNCVIPRPNRKRSLRRMLWRQSLKTWISLRFNRTIHTVPSFDDRSFPRECTVHIFSMSNTINNSAWKPNSRSSSHGPEIDE
jgi:hypothetical protein